LQELLDAGFIEEYVIKPQCINPLTASINSSGKPRLILDLRHMNSFVEKLKVKFEGSKHALDYAKTGDSMLKFDLKSC
jgi:predicted aspartyl protease